MRQFLFSCGVMLALAACSSPSPLPQSDNSTAAPVRSSAPIKGNLSSKDFLQVVDIVEPVAERICRSQSSGIKCDYNIVVDNRPNQPPNAFQTVDRSGRPIISFTAALIGQARNRDELAFILGHEAAHHIAGHLPKKQQSAVGGALLAGVLASIGGAEGDAVRAAQDIGAQVGARAYSKDFELEADALGTIIAHRSGFDPVLGAQYFSRIADPGNRFLGTHPPNRQRIETVRKTAADLRR